MNIISFEELLALSETDLFSLKEQARKSDYYAQCVIALHLIFAQKAEPYLKEAISYLETASGQGYPLALLLLGFCYEFSADEESYGKSISGAVTCYSRGYDFWNGIDRNNGGISEDLWTWWLSNAPKLRKQISEIVNTKEFCVFADNGFWFDWSDQTRKSVNALLLKLAGSVTGLESILSDNTLSWESDKEGELLYQIHDTLLMPLEIIKAVAGRDTLYSHLAGLGYSLPEHSRYLDRAMGRCLIDDDDKSDNDYIVSGLRIIAGTGHEPKWMFRTGLWYEYNPESKDLSEACRWYEKAEKHLVVAEKALSRVRAKDELKLIQDPSFGTAEDCVRIAQSYSSNLELANIWNIRAALRGDMSAIRKLEQTCTLSEDEDVDVATQYELLLNDLKYVKSTTSNWVAKVKLDQEQCFEEMAQKAKVAEAALKREEEERKITAENERISKLSPAQKFEEGKQLVLDNDYDKGVSLIKMASKEGLADASVFLAFGFEYGEGGIKKRADTPAKYYILYSRQADESHKDYPRAQFELGLQKESIASLKDEAIKHFEKAAELGYVKALSKMAFGYDFGNGCFPKDEIKALGYYEAFITKGDESYSDYKIALYNLGQCYYFGTHGVKVDEEKGINYYKQSAKLGYTKAQSRLDKIDLEKKELFAKMEEEARKQLKAIEDEKKAAEERKKSKKRQIIYFVIVSLVYIFFTARAIAGSHPFWVLFLGVLYTIYSLLWGGTFNRFLKKQKKRNPYWFIALISATITCVYFIVRAIELAHPFWMWCWIVIYAVLVAIDVMLYFIYKS